jgi:hypothetical protein
LLYRLWSDNGAGAPMFLLRRAWNRQPGSYFFSSSVLLRVLPVST